MTSHLDNRLFPCIDYTRRDKIICDLMGIIKCPILLDIAEDSVLFNNQFYNWVAFDTFCRGKHERSARAIASG